VGECFFWYWLTRIVPDKIQESCKTVIVEVVVIIASETQELFVHYITCISNYFAYMYFVLLSCMSEKGTMVEWRGV